MKRTGLVVAALAVVALAVVAALTLRGGSDTAAPLSGAPSASQAHNAKVPAHAYATLRHVDAGDWPDAAAAPGTKGGESWQNREGRLPRKDAAGASISYREWDVNPKQRGQGRDAERIVTGSDGSAWYTGDHYRTFVRMR